MAKKKKRTVKKQQVKGTWDIKKASKLELITTRVLLIILGLMLLLMGLYFVVLIPLGILSFYFAHVYKKELKRRKAQATELAKPKETPAAVPKEEPAVIPATPITEETPAAVIEEIPVISEERFNELKQMCRDIHKEYKELLKEYKDSDTEEKEHILSECYRKLTVIESTVNKHNCYDDIDVYEEYEKIEKKAKTFINAYIKAERENGCDDYMIDVLQFSDSLDFISDYIWEKDEKLNKI